MVYKIILSIAVVIISSSSHAYSGAGGECGNKDFERAATLGSAEELLKRIDDYIERVRTTAEKENTKSFLGLKLKSRQPLVTDQTELRKIVVNSWRGCEGLLLDYAVVAGNLRAIDLLIKLGADPNGRQKSDPSLQVAVGWDPKQIGFIPSNGTETIFMRCRYINESGDGITVFKNSNRTDEQRGRALAGYRHLIQYGVDLTLVDDHYGKSALESCRDIDVIRLILENGADPNRVTCVNTTNCGGSKTTSLDFHAIQILDRGQGYGSLGTDLENRLRLFETIAKYHKTKRLTNDTEIAVCMGCLGVADESCRALHETLVVSNLKIFDETGPKLSWTTKPSLYDQCRSLLTP